MGGIGHGIERAILHEGRGGNGGGMAACRKLGARAVSSDMGSRIDRVASKVGACDMERYRSVICCIAICLDREGHRVGLMADAVTLCRFCLLVCLFGMLEPDDTASSAAGGKHAGKDDDERLPELMALPGLGICALNCRSRLG